MTFALESFLFIFARISGLFVTAPIYSSRQVPMRVKIFVILIISACLTYAIPLTIPADTGSVSIVLVALGMEIMVGCTIGFVAFMVFAGIQLAGQVMDMQMGFGIVNVVDPLSGTQIPLMGNFSQTYALLLYLAVDGHHYLLQALADSYIAVPILGLSFSGSFMTELMRVSVYMFVIAVKIASPLVFAVFTTDIAMGFIGRTVPQMNVFIVGLPLRILVGFACLFIMLPIYYWVFQMVFATLFGHLDAIIAAMGM